MYQRLAAKSISEFSSINFKNFDNVTQRKILISVPILTGNSFLNFQQQYSVSKNIFWLILRLYARF